MSDDTDARGAALTAFVGVGGVMSDRLTEAVDRAIDAYLAALPPSDAERELAELKRRIAEAPEAWAVKNPDGKIIVDAVDRSHDLAFRSFVNQLRRDPEEMFGYTAAPARLLEMEGE